MLRPSHRRIAGLIAVVVAGCASSEPQAPKLAGELCDFDKKSTPTYFVSHITPRGALMQDDVSLDDYRAKSLDAIPSALARPKRVKYETEMRQDCYNQAGKYWYPCLVKVDIDLSQAAGVSRSVDLKEARFYAVFNCERVTQTLAASALKSGMFESANLECQVVEDKFCKIPVTK
ncbi:MAG: hypothetical protein ACKVSF_00910 [Alphaproteobacteria bacterium]